MSVAIKGVTKQYGPITALKGIDLQIDSGMFGLLGPNGAGKTTLMRILATLLEPSAGEFSVFGYNRRQKMEIRRTLGYLPQEFGFPPQLTAYGVLDYLAVLNGLHLSRREILAMLERVNLEQNAFQKVKGFSGGMKRRLGIACALINDPKLLIVDEPTAGLDPQARVNFRNLLAGLGGERVVILSTHIVADVESTCSRLALLVNGEIKFTGTPEELAASARGSVFTEKVPHEKLEDFRRTHRVVSIVRHTDWAEVRYLASNRKSGTPMEPTLEDGYLSVIGGDESE